MKFKEVNNTSGIQAQLHSGAEVMSLVLCPSSVPTPSVCQQRLDPGYLTFEGERNGESPFLSLCVSPEL